MQPWGRGWLVVQPESSHGRRRAGPRGAAACRPRRCPRDAGDALRPAAGFWRDGLPAGLCRPAGRRPGRERAGRPPDLPAIGVLPGGLRPRRGKAGRRLWPAGPGAPGGELSQPGSRRRGLGGAALGTLHALRPADALRPVIREPSDHVVVLAGREGFGRIIEPGEKAAVAAGDSAERGELVAARA